MAEKNVIILGCRRYIQNRDNHRWIRANHLEGTGISMLGKMTCLFIFLISIFATNLTCAEPAGYPAVRIDPATGKAYDLHGQTVYIYDYWTSTNWSEIEPATENEIATYNYRKWIESTYNCKVVRIQRGDWNTCANELINFAKKPDGTLCIFVVAPEEIGDVMKSSAAADLKNSSTIQINSARWNQITVELTSHNNSVYGMPDASYNDAICVYFNKRILKESQIDWEKIYDMQKDKTWTWKQFEKLLKQVVSDLDHDGVIDTYALVGNIDDLYRAAVFSNGGSFFDYDRSGNLISTANTEKSRTALSWAKSLWNKYARKERTDEVWDYYKHAWYRGECAFYVGRAYSGLTTDYESEMTGMTDPWGCVVFPKNSGVEEYVSVLNNNTAFIPNVYTKDQLSKITLIYDLWTAPTPNVEEDIQTEFGNITDERTLNETYALLMDPNLSISDKTILLGTINDILGVNLLWPLREDYFTLDYALDDAQRTWSKILKRFNQMSDTIPPELPLGLFDLNKVLYLPENTKNIGDYAFSNIDAEAIIIPDGCTSIGSKAFADNPQLKLILIPASVEQIADDAFSGSEPMIIGP